MPQPFVMPELAAADLGPTKEETVIAAGRTWRVLLPGSAEHILNLASTEQAFDQDEYMPYWATIWPVSVLLADYLAAQAWAPGLNALELGCGLGIAGLAASRAGLDVTLSDYDQTALSFVRQNAQLNDCGPVRTLAFDWRCPLPTTFDVILGADVLYERRSIAPIIGVLTAMLAPGGVALIADPNRPYAGEFQQALVAAGFVFSQVPGGHPLPSGGVGAGTIYRIGRSPG